MPSCFRCHEKKNLYTHLMRGYHEKRTPSKEKVELKKLVAEINKKRTSNPDSQKKSNKEERNLRNYLKFIALCISKNFSFSQTRRLGNFLGKLVKNNDFDFFKAHEFNRDEISKIAKECFGPHLCEKIEDDLNNRRESGWL